MNGVPTDFWGKLEKVDGEPPTAWHPLPHHCADVAACAEMLLSQRVLRRRLASCGGQADLSDVQVARLSALAALHDLGKFNAGFQAKREARPARVAGHVGPAIAHFQRLTLVSGRIWTSLRFDDFLPWTKSEEGVQRLLVAAIAHHGRPIEPSPTEGSVDWWVASGALDPFAGLADLGERVRQWFPLAFEHGTEPLPESPAFQHAFSGLVMLADWLGSDRKIFLFSKSVDADPMPLARQRAAEVAVRMGFDTTGPRRVLGDEPVAFDRVSSFPPRALQRALLELPTGKGGGVAILESETGSGKTEAAMARFLRLFQAGAVDGLYFALPTRTAATQIHRRVFEAAERAFRTTSRARGSGLPERRRQGGRPPRRVRGPLE